MLWLSALVLLAVLATGCDDEPTGYETAVVNVSLSGPVDGMQGVEVTLTDSRGTAYKQATGTDGVAPFVVPVGVYRATVSHVGEPHEGWRDIYNGQVAGVVVQRGERVDVSVPITVARTSAIVISELYVGGCQKDDGSGWFNRDKYIILANNTPQQVVLPGLCLAIATPYNSYGINKNYTADGSLSYEHEGFMPAASSFWYFQGSQVTFAPWEQKVIALNGAIDHTLTYSRSVNLANADYYCTYDIEHFTSTTYYPSPSELIATSHYLKAVRYGDDMETAWPLSATSPAVFIFTPPAGMTPQQFGADASLVWYDEGRAEATFACRKVPVECVLDGVEVFSTAWEESYKRLTASIDVGHVDLTARQGHALQRRVDQEATTRQGHTVYQDTNNSTADFVESERASLAN